MKQYCKYHIGQSEKNLGSVGIECSGELVNGVCNVHSALILELISSGDITGGSVRTEDNAIFRRGVLLGRKL